MSHKKILVISLLVIGITILGYFILDNKKTSNEEKLTGSILLQKIQKDVEQKMGVGYPKGFLGNGLNNVIAAIYLPNFLLKNEVSNANELNHPEEKEWAKQVRGGVIVFNLKYKIKKLWESQEIMNGTFGRAEFKDLNNDGKDELLVWWSNGKSNDLWTYKWTGTDFKLITPFEESINPDGNKENRLTFLAENIEVVDVDNDKNFEIKLPYTKIIKFLPDANGFNVIPVKENYIRTYKWDGTEKPYYLYKEEKIGE